MALTIRGDGIVFPTGTVANRPAASNNFIRVNTDLSTIENKTASGWGFADVNDGSNITKPAASAYWLRNTLGITVSGAYWINVNGTPKQLYCDMTTDGGGWAKIMECTGGLTAGGEVSVSYLATAATDTNSKLSDANIRYLAKYHSNYEWMLTNGSTYYICRYTSSNWDAWSAGGATNMYYAAKASNGTWSGYNYNGHYNNRGFSTFSDATGGECNTVFSGTIKYFTNYHTTDGAPGAPFSVYVR